MGSIPIRDHCGGSNGSRRWSVVDLLPYGVVLAGPDGTAAWVNRTWTQLTGQTERDWRGRGWLDVCDETDREASWSDLVAAARAGARHEVDWVISANGRGRRTLHVQAVPDTHGDRLTRIVVTATDVTEDRDRSAQLLDRASRDSMTGLLNRAQFLEFLDHTLERRRRGAEGITAVLFVDVDDLKATNDAFGHDAGDRLLCDVAARIKAGVRPADIVARYGGDEFTVLCEDLGDAAEAHVIADRIRRSARRDPCRDVSIGVALADGSDTDPDGLVTQADRAMYETRGVRWHRGAGGQPTATGSGMVWDKKPVRSAHEGGRVEHQRDDGRARTAVAPQEISAALTAIAGLATTLRADRERMEPGDVEAALASIEHHARRLELMLDQPRTSAVG